MLVEVAALSRARLLMSCMAAHTSLETSFLSNLSMPSSSSRFFFFLFLNPTQSQSIVHAQHTRNYYFCFVLFLLYSKQKRSCLKGDETKRKRKRKKKKAFIQICFLVFSFPFMIIYFLDDGFCCFAARNTRPHFCTGGLIIISISGIRNEGKD